MTTLILVWLLGTAASYVLLDRDVRLKFPSLSDAARRAIQLRHAALLIAYGPLLLIVLLVELVFREVVSRVKNIEG
jgi:hypothetical protein